MSTTTFTKFRINLFLNVHPWVVHYKKLLRWPAYCKGSLLSRRQWTFSKSPSLTNLFKGNYRVADHQSDSLTVTLKPHAYWYYSAIMWSTNTLPGLLLFQAWRERSLLFCLSYPSVKTPRLGQHLVTHVRQERSDSIRRYFSLRWCFRSQQSVHANNYPWYT